MSLSLPAYFERIGHSGPLAPTLATLRALHAAHTAAIPFENLTPFIGAAVELDLHTLHDKFVRQRRGGYCFEQNRYFRAVLETLGFRVDALAARVVWNAPPGALTARSHVLLRVWLDEGEYLADVGFGGLTLPTPLRFVTDMVQTTSHEDYRLRREGDSFTLEARINADWQAMYAFDLQPQHAIDFEVGNWYVSRHPKSRFVNQLIVARPQPGERHALVDNQYSRRQLAGGSERLTLETTRDLRALLGDVFGLGLPADAALEQRLQFVIERSRAAG